MVSKQKKGDKKNADGKIVVMLPTGGGNVEEIALAPEEFKEKLALCLSDL